MESLCNMVSRFQEPDLGLSVKEVTEVKRNKN